MTKEEIIREAYGEYWQKDIDKDGWLSYASFPEYFLRKKELLEFKGETQSNCFVRPKSLQGIENNNGWTKIESESDLPEQGGEYHVFINEKLSSAVYIKNNRWLVGSNNYPKTTETHGITHYQKIVKPNPPLF